MGLNIRNPNTQGLLSTLCSLAAMVLVPVLAFLVFQRFAMRERSIPYNPDSLRLPIILAISAVSGLLALVGFGLGISSIGQMRNDHPGRSWLGFLLGALGMVLSGLLFMAFYLLKEPVI
jgi:hypothetical protein